MRKDWNLTTECFVIVYIESTKLICRNSEEGQHFLPFRLTFTSPALSSTSARKILWARHWEATQLICCSWYVSGELQETSCLVILGLTYVQLKNPQRPELGMRHRTRQLHRKSWRKMPSSCFSVVQFPSGQSWALLFSYLHLPGHRQYLLMCFKNDS